MRARKEPVDPPWVKLWRHKLRGSARMRSLTLYELGLWLRLFIAADAQGRLTVGSRPMDLDDILVECSAPRSRSAIAKALAELQRLELVVKERDTLVVANYQRHQESGQW